MIINLTEGFNPISGAKLPIEIFKFPSGIESHIKIKNWAQRSDEPFLNEIEGTLLDIVFTLRIKTMDDLMVLFLATDAIRRYDNTLRIGVFFPYVPFARQDRVMDEGEPLSIKVFANLINSQNYNWVGFYDAHSEVTTALINNSYNFTNKSLWNNILFQNNLKDYYVCSPDAGASKKIFKLINVTRPMPKDIIQCQKVRNLSTGKITHLSMSHNDLDGKDVYIIDDICSYGGTFMMIAEKLRELNAGKINLVVSHWEGCADIHKLFNSGIDKIYATDSMGIVKYDKDEVLTNHDTKNSIAWSDFFNQFELTDLL